MGAENQIMLFDPFLVTICRIRKCGGRPTSLWFIGQPKIRSGCLILVKTNRRQYKKLCNVFIKG